VKQRLDLAVTDLGPTQLKNIAEPIRVYSLQVGVPAQAKPAAETKPPEPKKRLSLAPLALGFAVLVVLIAAAAWYFLANRAALAAFSPFPHRLPAMCSRQNETMPAPAG
jgi:adenylate cyclase